MAGRATVPVAARRRTIANKSSATAGMAGNPVPQAISQPPTEPSQAMGMTQRSPRRQPARSEEHTSELQSLMRISYAVFCLKKKKDKTTTHRQASIHTTHQ